MESSLRPDLIELFGQFEGEGFGCTLDEYIGLATLVRGMAPCRLLVFGLGRDTGAWIDTNWRGRTVFVENDPEWIETTRDTIPGVVVAHVSYDIRFESWRDDGFQLGEKLLVELPAEIEPRFWDVVFVDAPHGGRFGRQQSVFTGSRAVRPDGLLALHDCNRDREQAVCRHVLRPLGFELLAEAGRLRIYKAPGS